MEQIPNNTDNMLGVEQEAINKSHMTYDFLLLMSAVVVIAAIAVGMFIMVSS